MSITVFGFCWLGALCLVFISNNVRYMVFMTLFSVIFQSASVIVIGDDGVGPLIITSFAMIVWNVWKSGGRLIIAKHGGRVYKKISICAVLLLVLVILISWGNNRMNYRWQPIVFWMYFTQLMLYILCYFSCWNVCKWIDSEKVHGILMNVILFVAVVGAVQFMVTSGILPRSPLLNTFIYTPDTNSAYYWYERYYRVFSTFMEPSYCSAFLVGAFYYIISFRDPRRKELLLAVVLLVEIILTFSSTGYGAFFVCGILYLFFSKNKKYMWILLPFGVCAVLFLGVTGELSVVLNQVIFKKMNTGSGYTRRVMDGRAMNGFLQAKIWGVGYKNVRGSSFLISLAGQLGIMGIVSWCMSWLPLFVETWKNRNKEILAAAIYLLAGAICSMVIAVPDIDFCVFWGAMYMAAMVLGGCKHQVKGTEE